MHSLAISNPRDATEQGNELGAEMLRLVLGAALFNQIETSELHMEAED
jgi:hypothetical protein